MAREGALEDPAVPPDVGGPKKAPDVVREGPDSDTGDPEMPKVGQNTLEAPDVAAETPNPDVPWAKNGHRTLVVDSDTDVEEEGSNPDVGPQNQLKMTPNVPKTPDVRLKPPNPDVSWLKNGRGMLVVESDTDVEEEEDADPDVESLKQLKTTQNILETPDVAANTPNPDIPDPKMCRGMELVDSDTDVEEDPDVQPPKRLKVTQNVPGIPDVEVNIPNPAVEVPKMGHWRLLVESDTDEEEENPDMQPQKQLRMTQNVPETPDVAAKAPNPDVSGPKFCHRVLLVDSDTDVENEASPDVQSQKRLRVTQSVPRIPDVEGTVPNPAVGRPKIGHRTLVVDSDTDVEEDPDEEPPQRLKTAQNVPKTPDVRLGITNPDVSGPRIGCQMLLVDSDTDVEEDPAVESPKRLRVTQNVPETPDAAAKAPNPDVSGPEIGCRMFLVDSDTDVEEEEMNPDVEPPKKLKVTPNVPESPGVGLKTPYPDVGRTKKGHQGLLGDSDTDVEEDEMSPGVGPSERWIMTQNVPETPDVPSQTPNPAVEASQRGHRALLEDSITEVEEKVNPDVASLKRPKTAPVVPETPDVRLKTPNPDVSGPEIGCGTLLVDSETDVEEDEMSPDVGPSKRMKMTQNVPETPDVPTQAPNPDVDGSQRGRGELLEDSDPDVEEEAVPDVRPSKRRKITQNLPETPDVGPNPPGTDVGRLPGTQNSPKIPDVEEEEEGWDPDVATQPFLPLNPDMGEAEADPDVRSPKLLKTNQNPLRIPDVEEEEESDPDVATQLFLPPPDVGSPESPQRAPKIPKIPDVEGLRSLDPDVATQLFLAPDPDGEDHPNPDVLGPKQPKMASNDPRFPDVRVVTPDPDAEREEDFNVATQLFLPPNPDVEREGLSDPGVGSLKTPPAPLKLPKIPDVEAETKNPDVEELGAPCPHPDVATQLFLPPDPDVEDLECPKIAPNEPQIPDLEGETSNPDVGGAPSPTQEDTEAPPTPQVRRSRRLAESRGGGASSGPTPALSRHDKGSKPHPSPKPRPQRGQDRAGVGLEQATPSMPVKGNGRGSAAAPPPQKAEPAEGAKRSLRPRAVPGPTHIRVLFTGLVASPALLVALGTLGGTEATSVSDCSHLVTDGIRRTLKFLCALGRGVPIVTPQWLLQSSHSGRPLSPGPFLPRDHPSERRFGFRLRPALARARAQPLLQGYQVHVTPSVRPCPEDMRDIVTCCGGTFLPQLPREHAPRVLVISCPQDRALWAPAVAAGLPLLSAELLLSGVLRQRLDIAHFLLTPLKTPDPLLNPPNPPQNPPNPAQKPPSPTQSTPTPPQTPPQSPPRTRSGRRPPQKPPNSGTPQKTPNPSQKTPKWPQGHSEGPNPNFRVPEPPQEPPRSRSHRGHPQNPPRDPPDSGTPQKPPKRPPKNPNPPPKTPNPPPKTPKQSRGPPWGPNPNFGVPNLPLDPPQELPRTRSGRRPRPNSGMPQKPPNPPPKAPKRPQNTPNLIPNRPQGPTEGPCPNFGVPEAPPSPPRTRSRRGPPWDPLKTPIK